ncbi:hypothetical protein BN1723_017405, partial [Verticillium longisporum]
MLAEKRAPEMTDDEIVAMSMRGKIPGYALERTLKDFTRAVKIRRSIISQTKATSDITNVLERSKLPYEHYNWERVFGACCENVIGYMPLPVGVAGPLVIDGDPILSKWMWVALIMSVALNGYLFNVARWGIKDPNVSDHPIDRKELARAEKFNETGSATLPLGEYLPPP